VLYVNDEEPQPQVRKFPNFETLRRFLIDLPTGTFAVPIYGLPAYYNRIVKPTDRRYLVLPDGSLSPLFEAIEEIEIDSSFMLGDPDLDITPVTTATLTQTPGGRPARANRPSSAILEEDDIEEEEPELDEFPTL
jgi:hypothetical protein